MSEPTTRIAWVCALEDAESSRFSLPLLKQCGGDRDPEFKCHAFVAETQTESSLPIPVAPLAPDGMLAEILSTYDSAIFDLAGGESTAAMLRTLRRVSGVLILHDDAFQPFFVQRCFGELRSAAAFACLMHRYHGASGLAALLDSGAASDVFALIEPIAALASAVVVHSDEMRVFAESFFEGPVLHLRPPANASDEGYRQYLQGLKAFVRDNRELLRRRAGLVSPARDALPQQSPQLSDKHWWESLLRARSTHNEMERDPDNRSPEPFLKWNDNDLAKLIACFFLDARNVAELTAAVLSFLHVTGKRWQLYEAVSKLRWLQDFCQSGSPPLGDAILPAEPVWHTQFWALACQLKPPIFARLLYLAILRRPWKEYEPNSWAQLVESGTAPATVLQRFLATAECRELMPERLRNGLMAWAEEQALVQSLTGGGIADEWRQAIRVHFGDRSCESPRRFIGQWYAPEPAGRWTNGRYGGLSFRLPADLVSPVSLRLRLRVAGTEHTGARNIEAYCNGHCIGSLHLTNDAPNDWIIPLNSAVSRNVTLVLVADRAFSPASMAGSSDVRDLGIMIIEGMLVPGVPREDLSNFSARNQP